MTEEAREELYYEIMEEIGFQKDSDGLAPLLAPYLDVVEAAANLTDVGSPSVQGMMSYTTLCKALEALPTEEA